MPYSEQAQAIVAYKVQSALGTQATGASAEVLRTTGGGGGQIQKNAIESKEIRQDAMSTRGRHGSQRATGAYDTELSLGNLDTILEALLGGTWGTANLQIDETDFTSITTTAGTIVLASGSPISLGFFVGDVIRLTNHSTAGNNNRNLRITALSATTITVAETLTLDAVADTAVEITRTGRVLINPASGSQVKRYFTIDEYDVLLDQSEVFTDCVWSALTFSMSPDGVIMANPSFTGTGQFEALATGSSPLMTSPTQSNGLPMAAIDATLRLGSGDVVDLTGLEISIDRTAVAPPVIANNYAPDVFLGSNSISMNLTMLRSDLLDVTTFLNETPTTLNLLITEVADSAPEDFISIHVPNFTFGSVDKSPLAKEGGPRTQTIAIPNALIGVDETGSGYDATMIKFQVSNGS